MKKTKPYIFLIGLICTFFIFLPTAFAENESDIIVSLQIDNPNMKVNGETKEIDAGRGTKPIIQNGRTLVPIRAIIEAFGGTVGWKENSKAVILNMENDSIKLTIDSYTAYLNNKAEKLDVAPTIINDRTMLPIRFVAEGFNLGIAWDESAKTVSVIRNSFDDDEYNHLQRILPEYSGKAYTFINNNEPFFKEYEIIKGSFEYYSELDELGRCDVCFSSIAKDIMPAEERKSISSVTPTGWINADYDIVDGGYLYNRCHLIGFQLTGENANERNLITGTRYLNVEGMLPFENDVAEYIEKTGNRVIYRSTPVFTGDNLVADGVLLEAYSVEDGGEGISFCVFCYNVQPGIEINYMTGRSYEDETFSGKETDINILFNVYRTPSGKKYHFDAECGGRNSFRISIEEAKTLGLTACKKCAE